MKEVFPIAASGKLKKSWQPGDSACLDPDDFDEGNIDSHVSEYMIPLNDNYNYLTEGKGKAVQMLKMPTIASCIGDIVRKPIRQGTVNGVANRLES